MEREQDRRNVNGTDALNRSDLVSASAYLSADADHPKPRVSRFAGAAPTGWVLHGLDRRIRLHNYTSDTISMSVAFDEASPLSGSCRSPRSRERPNDAARPGEASFVADRGPGTCRQRHRRAGCRSVGGCLSGPGAHRTVTRSAPLMLGALSSVPASRSVVRGVPTQCMTPRLPRSRPGSAADRRLAGTTRPAAPR